MARLANRVDAFGKYLAAGGSITEKTLLTIDVLLAHFRAMTIIGLHAIGLDNLCRFAAWDYDQHDAENHELAAANLRDALQLAANLQALGFHPLIEDSDGKGGIHVWVYFKTPRLARDVHPWAKAIAVGPCESFPKQARVSPKPGKGHYGNFIRLPGKHHKRQHYSRFYVDGRWVEGEAAVQVLLNWVASETTAIPEVTEVPAAPACPRVRNADDAERAVDLLQRLRPDRMDIYDDWLHIGMILHEVDSSAGMLAEWDRWSSQSPKYESGMCAQKWATFNGEGRRLGMGTLVRMAEEDSGTASPSSGHPSGDPVSENREDDESGDGAIPLGQRDPATGKLVLSPKRTLPTARAFVAQFHLHQNLRTFHSYAGVLMVWRGNRFVEIEEESLRHRLQPWLHGSLRYQLVKKAPPTLVPFEGNPSTIKAAVESIRAFAHLPVTMTPTCWLDGRTSPAPMNLLPYPSGTLDLSTGAILPPTPALFNINAIDFEYDSDPPAPERWIKFLEQLWGDDLEAVELLQEWMGYCLVADTSLQKMLLIVGPKRSGKGTIGRVQTRLVGTGNVIGPTTSSLAGPFGLQPLIGKSLAIVSDARFTADNIGVVVERLLCISGEDMLTVDRKFLGSVTMKLPTRFMFLTNELPRMNDASGALAGRFMILRLTKSFYGQEDPALTSQLLEELPGILLWAIDGLKRLRARGHFVQPQSVADAMQQMEDLASPVLAFVRDWCELGVGLRTWVDDLYAAWKQWCEQDGRNIVSNKQTFGRDLASAIPSVNCRRHSIQGRFYEGIALRSGGVQ